MANAPFPKNSLGLTDLISCLDLVDSWIKVLDRTDRVLWANRAWREAMGLSENDAAGSTPRDYFDGPRLGEYENLLRRAREHGKSLRFEDAWMGRAIRTVITPLPESRLIVVTNLATLDGASRRHDARTSEEIEFRHKSWGPLDRLTDRERQVLGLLAKGLTIKDAAKTLERSEKTIEGHRDSIYRKLGAGSRAELASIAVRSGLLPHPSDENEPI